MKIKLAHVKHIPECFNDILFNYIDKEGNHSHRSVRIFKVEPIGKMKIGSLVIENFRVFAIDKEIDEVRSFLLEQMSDIYYIDEEQDPVYISNVNYSTVLSEFHRLLNIGKVQVMQSDTKIAFIGYNNQEIDILSQVAHHLNFEVVSVTEHPDIQLIKGFGDSLSEDGVEFTNFVAFIEKHFNYTGFIKKGKNSIRHFSNNLDCVMVGTMLNGAFRMFNANDLSADLVRKPKLDLEQIFKTSTKIDECELYAHISSLVISQIGERCGKIEFEYEWLNKLQIEKVIGTETNYNKIRQQLTKNGFQAFYVKSRDELCLVKVTH